MLYFLKRESRKLNNSVRKSLKFTSLLPSPIAGLMTFREDYPKYLLGEQEQLVGLNLAATELDDHRWQKIVVLR